MVATPEQQQPGRAPGVRAYQLGRPFGVPILVSPSWLLFLGFVTIQSAPRVGDAIPGIGGARYVVAFAFGIFLGLSVLAHEIGHCWVARRFGVPIERISLSFLAGHSAFGREPETPGRMFAVAAAGPTVNILISVAAWAAFIALPGATVGSVLAAGLAGANVLVGLFNLLPGLPLDGGQLLRALIWRISGSQRSGTVGAAWAGRMIAIVTGIFGIAMLSRPSNQGQFGGLWALLVAGVIWIGSTAVLSQQVLRDRLPAISARTLARRALPVAADLPLAEAVRRAQESQARGLIIVDGLGRPTGVVNEAAVTATPIERRPWVSVGSVSRGITAPQLLPVQLEGEQLLKQLQAAPATEYVVVEPDGQIYGVLAASDVATALRG
jgi:Zn-dependent protease/CBS domain-containing protein